MLPEAKWNFFFLEKIDAFNHTQLLIFIKVLPNEILISKRDFISERKKCTAAAGKRGEVN